ncbi:hypothetical protein Avbf_08530 [Armadillidium vulgare]|nr:hypothetical protein Avbf_08530 [Armadillidium vulgare]
MQSINMFHFDSEREYIEDRTRLYDNIYIDLKGAQNATYVNQVQLLNDVPHGQKEKDINDKDSPSVAIQKKLDHARRMLQQSDSSGDKTGKLHIKYYV